MQEIKIEDLRSMAEKLDFEKFCEKLAEILPTESNKIRRNTRIIYDMLKNETDDSVVLLKIEESLEESERKGMKKGIFIGIAASVTVAALIKFLSKGD